MKKTLIILAFIAIMGLLSLPSLALVYFSYPYLSSARDVGMGNAVTSIADDAASVIYNPAGIAFIKNNQLEGTFPANYYYKDYVYYNIAGVFPTEQGNIGLSLYQFNLDMLVYPPDVTTYRNQRATLSYARKLTDNISVGLNFNEYMVSFYGADASTPFGKADTIDIGLLIRTDGPLTIGAMLESAAAGYMLVDDTDETHETAPRYFCLGLSYKLLPGITVAVDGKRFIDNQYDNIDTYSGLEWELAPFLTARAGTNWIADRWLEYTMTSTYGLSLQFGGVCLDCARMNAMDQDQYSYSLRVNF